MDFRIFPKTELHLHLDCSPSFDLIRRLDPSVTRETYEQTFALSEKCTDLAQFLSHVPRLLACMQTEYQLRALVADLFLQLARDGVIYAEIRFAPHQHTEAGLSPAQVVAIVADALDKAVVESSVEGRLILCSLRHYNQTQALETAELVAQFKGSRVVALDLAADEAGFPIQPQVAAFRYAHERGLFCTAHAGEALGPESVWQTLEVLSPHRIGHGVRSIEDARLITHLAENQIHLEVCPSCNVLIDVYSTMENHPVNELLEAGIPISISTDGRTLPAITQTDQYQSLAETFGWGPEQFLACNLYAIEAAFIPETLKQTLKARLQAGYSMDEH